MGSKRPTDSSSNPDTLINIACDFVGISKIDRDGQTRVEQITKEYLKETLKLAQKWSRHSARRKVTVSDITNALMMVQGGKKSKSILGLIDTYNLGIDQLTPIQGSSNLYCRPNRDIDVETGQPATDLIPVLPRIKSYFLVTDGKLTKSAYNPNLTDEEEEDEDEDEEDENFTDHSVKYNPSSTRMFLEAAIPVKTEQIVALKPHVVEALTVEQQVFMKDVITVCMGQDDKKRHEALQTLETDSGLQALLPYLSQMICKSIAANISQRCLSLIIYAGRILRAICQNKAADLTLVLHEILPALLSCMVGRNICLRPETDNHWALRDYSTKTLLTIVRDQISRESASEFRGRIFQFAYNVFKSESSTAPMVYGTVIVLAEFVEPDKIQWLLGEFAEVMAKHRQIQMENSNRHNGHLIASESAKLYQQLNKYDGGLRGKLNNNRNRN